MQRPRQLRSKERNSTRASPLRTIPLLLRNSVDGNQLITHRKCLFLHSFKSSLLIFLLISCLAGFDIASAVFEQGIVDHSDLTGGGGNRFRSTDASSEPAVKSA